MFGLMVQIPYVVCSIVAYSCNRRHNGFQVKNALYMLACGVTERVNFWLQALGLVSARSTALRVMDRLRVLTEERITFEMAQPRTILPFLCVDNIDFEARVHFKRLKQSSRMFHGTWGYLHILPEYLTEGVSEVDGSLSTFVQSMLEAENQAVELSTFFPTSNDWAHWKLAIKALITQALITYVLPESVPAPAVPRSPPTVEKIPFNEPNIIMLKMMDAADNSAEGVSDLLEQIRWQTGLDEVQASKDVQIVEGDVGTCKNFESLRCKRMPSGHREESLENILTIPGAVKQS